MCKFQQPQIPANVTADERRAIYFDALYSLDLRDKVEKYNDLSYLSWANAWTEFKWCYPSAIYRIIKNPETNLPYFVDSQIGIMVYTEVTVDGITHEMWLPVMNNANKSMKLDPTPTRYLISSRKNMWKRQWKQLPCLTSTRPLCGVW